VRGLAAATRRHPPPLNTDHFPLCCRPPPLPPQIRKRAHRKRPLQSLRFAVTPSLEISVKAFALALRAKPPAPSMQWARGAAVALARQRAWYSTDTGDEARARPRRL